MGKRHDLVKKLREMEVLESKLLRRIDSLQRNLFEVRAFRINLEQLLTPAQDSTAKAENLGVLE